MKTFLIICFVFFGILTAFYIEHNRYTLVCDYKKQSMFVFDCISKPNGRKSLDKCGLESEKIFCKKIKKGLFQ